jgi:hypothetical protein
MDADYKKFREVNIKYKTFREAYDLRHSMGLAKDISFSLDYDWLSSPFSGAQVVGLIDYTNLASPASGRKCDVPVFVAMLPGISKEIFDKVCRNENRKGSTEAERRAKVATILLISATPTILYNDKELHSHPMVNSMIIKALTDGIAYSGGDIEHIDGETIHEDILIMRQAEYGAPRVFVNEHVKTIHPTQITSDNENVIDNSNQNHSDSTPSI